jgi:hypothetical protein
VAVGNPGAVIANAGLSAYMDWRQEQVAKGEMEPYDPNTYLGSGDPIGFYDWTISIDSSTLGSWVGAGTIVQLVVCDGAGMAPSFVAAGAREVVAPRAKVCSADSSGFNWEFWTRVAGVTDHGEKRNVGDAFAAASGNTSSLGISSPFGSKPWVLQSSPAAQGHTVLSPGVAQILDPPGTKYGVGSPVTTWVTFDTPMLPYDPLTFVSVEGDCNPVMVSARWVDARHLKIVWIPVVPDRGVGIRVQAQRAVSEDDPGIQLDGNGSEVTIVGRAGTSWVGIETGPPATEHVGPNEDDEVWGYGCVGSGAPAQVPQEVLWLPTPTPTRTPPLTRTPTPTGTPSLDTPAYCQFALDLFTCDPPTPIRNIYVGGSGASTAPKTPSPSETPTPTETPSLTPTETASLTPTETGLPTTTTGTPSEGVSPTITRSATTTRTASPTPTRTATPTVTRTPTITPTPTRTPTPTSTSKPVVTGVSVTFSIVNGNELDFTFHLSGATGINDWEIFFDDQSPRFPEPSSFQGPSGWTETFAPGLSFFRACAGSNATCNGQTLLKDGDSFKLFFSGAVPSYCQLDLHLTRDGVNLGNTIATRPGC